MSLWMPPDWVEAARSRDAGGDRFAAVGPEDAPEESAKAAGAAGSAPDPGAEPAQAAGDETAAAVSDVGAPAGEAVRPAAAPSEPPDAGGDPDRAAEASAGPGDEAVAAEVTAAGARRSAVPASEIERPAAAASGVDASDEWEPAADEPADVAAAASARSDAVADTFVGTEPEPLSGETGEPAAVPAPVSDVVPGVDPDAATAIGGRLNGVPRPMTEPTRDAGSDDTVVLRAELPPEPAARQDAVGVAPVPEPADLVGSDETVVLRAADVATAAGSVSPEPDDPERAAAPWPWFVAKAERETDAPPAAEPEPVVAESLPPLPKRTPRPPPDLAGGSGSGWSPLQPTSDELAPPLTAVPPPFAAPGAFGLGQPTFPLTSRQPMTGIGSQIDADAPADRWVPPRRPSTALPPVHMSTDDLPPEAPAPAGGGPTDRAPAGPDSTPTGPAPAGPAPAGSNGSALPFWPAADPPPSAAPATPPEAPEDATEVLDAPTEAPADPPADPDRTETAEPRPAAPTAQTATPQTEALQTEALRTEAARPEALRTEAARPEAARPDAAPTGYEEDPTEILGPFDVGQWTQDAAAGAARTRRGSPSRRGHHDVGHDHGAGSHDRRISAAVVEEARARASSRAGARPGGPASGSGAAPAGRSAASRPPATRGDRIRTVVRGAGQTLITLGVVVLLFVAYEVWITDLMNAQTQKRLGSTLAKEWEQGDDPVVGSQGPRRPGEKVSRIPLGKGFANIYIPEFGLDYVYTIVEGTDPNELDLGPGHYVNTVLPGQVGNFSLAGHRVGKGSPFLNLDKLRAGDAIVIETKDFWYTYRVLGNQSTGDPSQPGSIGVPGMQIVPPTDVDVIKPVPGNSRVKARYPLITLTTCHPKFSARQRLIIHGRLDGKPWPKSQGDPPALGRR